MEAVPEKRGPGRPRKEPDPVENTELSAKDLISSIAGEVAKQTVAREVIFKSKKPEGGITYPLNPDNYDVKAEADKVFSANGHTMSQWLAVADVRDGEMWHCKCLTCGEHGYARWRTTPPRNDPGAKNASKPYFGGTCAVKTEAELKGSNARNARLSFNARPGMRQ